MEFEFSPREKEKLYQWLLDASEPWTRYRTMVDLLEMAHDDPQVVSARTGMLEHPKVRELICDSSKFPGYPLKRHNDARHVIHKLSALADFGIHASDPGMGIVIQSIMEHQTLDGAFQILINIPTIFGGTGEDNWCWILCDYPTLLYSLLAFGLERDPRVWKSINFLESLVEKNGYRCKASPDLGKFKGPGKKSDPCPIANVYALKAISMVPGKINSEATHIAAEVLLHHWECRGEYKLFLFGIGTDFHKLKYPFIWYDILHVAEVLSRFSFLYHDPRFLELINTVTNQTNREGRFVAGSMYQAWKGWSFADKKNPSPWLTFLVLRILKRIETQLPVANIQEI